GGADTGGSWARGKALPVGLYEPKEDDKVQRFSAADLLAERLNFTAKPTSGFTAPDHVIWSDEDRVQQLIANATAGRIGGDVSRKGETAPELKDCKPLEVNEETRWKGKVLGGDDAELSEYDAIIKTALVVLNKLTLTNFNKLSKQWLQSGICDTEELVQAGVEIIVTKAQQESHFSEMYARLCQVMSGQVQNFKRVVVERCQKEFEKKPEEKLEAHWKEEDGEEEKTYWTGLIKKYYLGHMRFIGELYLIDLISQKVMLKILPTLLGEDDDEKIECFSKLFETVGYKLEQQAAHNKANGKPSSSDALEECWVNVDEIISDKATGSRIRFMLLDLKEMKQKGWVSRRKVEKAKTLDEIHRDVAREEARAGQSGGRSGGGGSRGGNNNNNNNNNNRPAMGQGDARKQRPQVDSDGWATVNKPAGRPSRQTSNGSSSNNTSLNNSNKQSSFAALAGSPNAAKTYPKPTCEPAESGKRFQSAVKEYLTNGDINEPVTILGQVVGGSAEHGNVAVGKAFDFALEGKASDCAAVVAIIAKGVEAGALPKKCVTSGIIESLEFLFDIAIDAPLAPKNAFNVCSKLVDAGCFDKDAVGTIGEMGGFRGDKAVAWAQELGCDGAVLDKLR
ncbi:hypothetical protein TL16_g12648, partial [Triparma laevis f. inornata]